MTRTSTLHLPAAVAGLAAEYGALRVLGAALTTAMIRPLARPDAADMPDYLRRDVGLPEAAPPTRIAEFMR